MFSRSYLALLAIGKTGGKQRTSETSKKKTNVYSHLQGPLVAATFAAVRIIVAESLGVFEDLAASAATRTSEQLQLVSCIDWLKTRAFAADKTSKAANQSNTNSPLQIIKKKEAQGQRRQEAERLVAQEQYSRRITRQRQLQRKLKN